MIKEIYTDRLILRPFQLSDAPFIIELLNSEGWIRYIGDRNIKTREQAEQYLLNGPFKSYETNGFGLSLVALKESREPIGMCGLIRRDTLPHVDLGFAFLPRHIGAGYGYEIAKATLNHGFEVLNLPKVVAITLPDNLRSILLLKKLGFQYEEPHLSQGEELMMFGISRPEVS